jgi:dolichol kinase
VAQSHHALSSAPLVQPLSLQHEFYRKALHLAAVTFPAAYRLGAPRGVLLWVLAVTCATALLIERLRRSNAACARVFERAAGPLMRTGEQREVTGATWLAISCLIAVALLSRQAAIAALWCATAGDPAATLVGRVWTMRRAPHDPGAGRKTPAGSLACASVSFAGTWLLAGYSPLLAAPIAVAAAIAEAIPVRLDDNIRVMAAAGAIAGLLA